MRRFLHAMVEAERLEVATPPLSPHYAIRQSRLPASIARLVVPLNQDDSSTAAFIDECVHTSPPRCWKSYAAACLRVCFSVTTANGAVGRGQMHVLSTAQLRTILLAVRSTQPPSTKSSRRQRLLDVGAGDGTVTAQLAPLFDEVVTTEVSSSMARSLRARRWRCVQTADLAELLPSEAGRYDVVTLLNLLDRCSQPRALLTAAKTLLAPDGVLLIAVVLPFEPFVERGPCKLRPAERLPILARDFEGAVAEIVRDVLAPAGLAARVVSRVPYLCKGDMTSKYYVISDAIVACVISDADDNAANALEGDALLHSHHHSPASLHFSRTGAG
tara:strand:- start:1745 stop:2734 length:990 start_codon:yes stop_codon:yes gene_type:complete